MSWEVKSLDELIDDGVIELGRGKVISKRDLEAHPGTYPVYSSAKENDGMFGAYGQYMFDEELITWSVDGGGNLFHRPKHKFSVTNVGGTLRLLERSVLDYQFLFHVLTYLHARIPFDWVLKAHPSVIRRLYTEIPVPPLPEQQRIVGKLDAAFAALAEAQAHVERNRANARELFESYLNGVFEGKGGWTVKTLGELGKVSMCKRIMKHETAPTGDIPFYKIGTFGKEPDAFIPKEIYNDFKRKYPYPKKGDVLISASGTIGRGVVFDGEPAYFQDSNIVWIENDESQVLNEYLFQFYKVCDWNPSKGATISRLYNDDLRRVKISFPSVQEQRLLVAQMVELDAQSRSLEATYQQKLTELAGLKKAVLGAAFRGEL